MEAYDYAMRGLQFALQAGKESQLKALAAYQQGLKKFPNSTRLRFYLAFAYRRIVEAGWSETPDRDLETDILNLQSAPSGSVEGRGNIVNRLWNP